MSISVIIPNYNGAKLLENNIPKVVDAVECYLEKTKEKGETIVVDDASTDASRSVISNFLSQNSSLKFIENEKNLGFSPTVNRGVKEASGEIVILLNSDVIPEKDFLMPLLAHFEKSDVFAVGCMDKSVEGNSTVLRGRGIGVWRNGFFVHARGEVDKTNTLWVNGGSGAFRKSLWEKLGGFNELYAPFYWEDIDLSYRAQKSGYAVIFEPKSIVVHEHEKGAIKTSESSGKVKKIAYRNQFIFIWTNADFTTLITHFLWLPVHKVKALLSLDFAFFSGLMSATFLLRKIQRQRIKNEKLFAKKDAEVVAPFVKEFYLTTV